jgi:hypothetical protein
VTRPVRFDLPILAIAVVLSSVILFNIGIQLAKDRCLDAGGRVHETGLDRLCELGGGETIPMNIMPATPLAWFLAVALWIVLVLGLTWGMSRFVRRGARRPSAQARGPSR